MSVRAQDDVGSAPDEADRDDIEAYVATFDERERRDLAAAEAAIDIARLLHRLRTRRGLSQRAAAQLAGLHQQAVSRFERPDASPRLETLQAYLDALGYRLAIQAIDLETGKSAATVVFPANSRRRRRGTTRSARERRRSPRDRAAQPPSVAQPAISSATGE